MTKSPKVYCVFKREEYTSDRDGYPVYDHILEICFRKKEDAEKYCNEFSDERDFMDDELHYIVERNLL